MRIPIGSIVLLILVLCLTSCISKNDVRRISVEEYQSKMKAGWLGQMAGVGWGASTEFKFNARIIPEDKVPAWEPGMINQPHQDDIYVEMTFLKTLEDYGFDVSIRQAGIDFANSLNGMDGANRYGRDNLRSGIAPPYSGHPKYLAYADDIDYQIESDFSGLIAPGMPQTVIELGNKFGHLMAYGDGMYGGQFIGAMYAEAFFETDMEKIVQAGLACIPAGSQYAEAIRDVVKWHKENPDDWQKSWQLVEDKYNRKPDYRKFSSSGPDWDFNIDAKLNGAYVVMGLLYGDRDMDKTIIISIRCGMDSDCNPSNAGGILATSLGLEKLPENFKTNIDYTTNFSHTAYNITSLLKLCNVLSKDALVRAGGRIEVNSEGIEEYVIPIQIPVVAPLEQCWEPKEIEGNIYFTPEEMEKIKIKARRLEDYVTHWQVTGPFTKKGVKGLDLFDVKFGPEENSEYADWKEMPMARYNYDAKVMNLGEFLKKGQCVAYLKTTIWNETKRKVIFELGSSDGIKVWLNDNLVHQKNGKRGHKQGDDVVEVNLVEGWNKILMKLNHGENEWRASLVITNLDHNPLKELEYK